MVRGPEKKMSPTILSDAWVSHILCTLSVPENRFQSVIPGGADHPRLHGRGVADFGLETPSGDGKLSLLWLGIVFGGVVVGHGRHFEGLWEEAIWKEMNDSLGISISFEYFWHSRWPVDEKKAMEAKSFGGSSYKWLSHILWPLVALRCNLIPSG